MSKFKSISDIISNEKPFEQFNTSVNGYMVVDKFLEIFPELKKVAKAKKYDKGILFVHAENSVWRSELNLHKQSMIKKINSYFKKEVIKNVKFI